MVKAGLSQTQFPAVQSIAPRSQRLRTRGPQNMVLKGPAPKPFLWGAMGSEPIQGNERVTYVALERLASVNMGSPTGRESYGDGTPVVVGGRESRPHGEGAAHESEPEPDLLDTGLAG